MFPLRRLYFQRILHILTSRRVWLPGLILFLTWDIFRALLPAPSELVSISARPPANERYFIASIHWNNEEILRSHWVQAVVDLVRFLGPDNAFVSVLESGSWDDSKGALRILQDQLTILGAPHNIVLDETTHEDEITRIPGPDEAGWIETPRQRKELRRIPYLSRLRNTVMEDLRKTNTTGGRPFTKVLWLNDVIFTTQDILTLLNTREGNYAAACSLDSSKPPKYYDTFALRDLGGNKPIVQTWPYFLASESFRPLIGNKPVPVKSCWNGVVAMDAQPFYNEPPLKFRGIPDSLALYHLEASECCLIHADNPLSSKKGVWLNPNVRVGYNPVAYRTVNAAANPRWPPFFVRMKGVWHVRLVTITGLPRRIAEYVAVVWRLRNWQSAAVTKSQERSEKGVHCLINEMQVLVENGWKHL